MELFQFPFQQSLKGQLPAHIQELITAAGQAADKAYAPYSHFKVGATLLMADGSMRSGANHENAAYPAGICAERAVLSTLEMQAGQRVVAIAIAYKSERAARMPLSPCGICRQSLLETQLHQGAPIAVYMTSPGGEVILVEDAAFLLPFYFSGSHLGGA